jgi:hypothetical protein
MRKTFWLLLLGGVITFCFDGVSQEIPHVGSQACRIVDISPMGRGEIYVDGMRVPEELGLLNFLRQSEKSSPSSCLRAFVPLTTTIRDIEDLRVIAGKMQYEEFHVYVYEKDYRDSVSEIVFGSTFNADELRSSPRGPVAWPDRQHATTKGGQR